MATDPLAIIAESYRGIHESTQVIAQAPLHMQESQQTLAQTQLRMEETHRLGLRLQAFALCLIGFTLLGSGVLIWQHLAHRQESAALNQTVLNNTQIIEAETRAILERMRQP